MTAGMFRQVVLALALSSISLHAQNWPQHQRDPWHSGYSPVEVPPPYRIRWVWLNGQGRVNGPPFELTKAWDTSGSMQVIVAERKVLFGTLEGGFYALDAASGQELWRFSSGWPILATAAAAGGRVVFTSQDGNVYCLELAGGALAWKLKTGAGIWTAPVIEGEGVYVSSRDGAVYAIDLRGGTLRWKAQTDQPILCTPAVRNGRVFVGSEDCCAYGFDARTGRQLWRTPLPGGSFYLSWPVATDDAVYFRMMSQFAAVETDREAEQRLARAGAGGWQAERKEILEHLEKYPHRRSFFALDPATGKEKFVVPMLYTSANGAVPTPPIVTPQGRVLAVFRPGQSSLFYKGPTYGTGFTPDISELDTKSGDRIRLPLKNVPVCLVADNTGHLTMGGDTIYYDHRCFVSWSFNVKTGRYEGIIRNRQSEATPPAAPNWLWTREQAPDHASSRDFAPFRGFGAWGISAITIADGRLYCNQLGGAIVCIQSADGGQR